MGSVRLIACGAIDLGGSRGRVSQDFGCVLLDLDLQSPD